MTIEENILVTIFFAAICFWIGFFGIRLYKRWKIWCQRNWLVVPGDSITIVSSNGEETYTVKGIKRTTITLDGH